MMGREDERRGRGDEEEEETRENRTKQTTIRPPQSFFFLFFIRYAREGRKPKDRAGIRNRILYTSRLKDTRKKKKKKKQSSARFSHLTFYIVSVSVFCISSSSTESTVLENRSMYVRAK